MELDTSSHKRLGRELRLVSVECNFQRVRCISLAASASLLSSVIALYWGRLLRFIICENGTMSRLRLSLVMETGWGGGQSRTPLTAYPAIARGAAKDQLRGRREFFPNGQFDVRPLSLYRTVIRIGAAPGACWLVYSITDQRIRAAMRNDTGGLLGQKFRRKHDLRFQRDLVTHMLAVTDLAYIPLLLSHTTPPIYTLIVGQRISAC